MSYYFEKYESRVPPEPIPYSLKRELLWQFLATITLCLGAWYIGWRWLYSINYDALWFSIPLICAETAAYIGLILFSINLWRVRDYPERPAPKSIRQCISDKTSPDRLIKVDIFFPSYDEDPDLVKLSILDAKNVTYPHPIDLNIYILDDGRREAMQQLASEMGVNYITRNTNEGYKAGNLRNAMEQTSGDFIVICDADTRPFPTILEHTLGYFIDPDVAWVQTPQWFFDLPEGLTLPQYLEKRVGKFASPLGHAIEKLIGPIVIGKDPFANDPQMFYDIIQRRRNAANASFCCGAGSIHRREAVMEVALKTYAGQIQTSVTNQLRELKKSTKEKNIDADVVDMMRRELLQSTEFTPYKFHVSEDIYTSIVLHSDPDREWKSVLHPRVESKMLSPQDLQTWIVQRFKYAGGTLDISKSDNPVFRKGMSFQQRIMYATTIWSYLGCIWNVLFLTAPLIYLFTGISPVSSYSAAFFAHIIPFIVMNELATMVGTWGIAGYKCKSSYLSFFSVNLKALWTVMKGEEIKFPVTSKSRQEGNFFYLVIPQVAVIVLTITALVFAIYIYNHGNSMSYSMSGLVTNTLWCTSNVLAMLGLVMSAFWKPEEK